MATAGRPPKNSINCRKSAAGAWRRLTIQRPKVSAPKKFRLPDSCGTQLKPFQAAIRDKLCMGKIVVRAIANVIILIGVFLLGRGLYYGLSGVLAQHYFTQSQGSVIQNVYALGLSLPIPLHIIAVGWVLQLRWLSPAWARATRWGIVLSGCWLGIALAIRWLAL